MKNFLFRAVLFSSLGALKFSVALFCFVVKEKIIFVYYIVMLWGKNFYYFLVVIERN